MSCPGHIHFFDLMHKGTGSWSPHCAKVRAVLNYKQIPFVESYVSYPDIAALYEHFDLPDDVAAEQPTLPAIVHYAPDGSVIKALGNSEDIARYLDEIVPERPVIPIIPGYPKLYESFNKGFFLPAVNAGVQLGAHNIAIPKIPAILDERAYEYFIRTRTEDDEHHRSPEDWGSADPEEDWSIFRTGIDRFVDVLKVSSSAGPFFFGPTPTYVDLKFAGLLIWFKKGSEDNFERILRMSEQGGELQRFWNACAGWAEGLGTIKVWDVAQMKVVE